jgi:hypothetical protein
MCPDVRPGVRRFRLAFGRLRNGLWIVHGVCGDIQSIRRRCRDGSDAAGDDEFALTAIGCGDFDAALLHGDGRARFVDGDREHRPLHQSDEIGCADAEMRRVLLFDAEDGTAIILEHLDNAFGIARLGEAQAGSGRDDDVILAADEDGPGAGAGLDDVSGTQHRTAMHLNDPHTLMNVDLAGGFGDPPGGLAGRCGRASSAEGEEDQDMAQRHGDVSSACTQPAHRSLMALPH